jgi:CIC family chloride channel protein
MIRRDAAALRLFLRVQRSENTALLVLAVAVGIAAGLGVWIYREGIEFFHILLVEQLTNVTLAQVFGAGAIVVTLTLVGLISGWILQRFIGEERHHGVAGIMQAVAMGGGRLRYWRMPVKAFVSAFSLSAGISTGPEDPSVQIGSNIGSLLGQKLHLSDDRVRVLVAAGGGAAIAAIFHAPIAGVFFALEVILNGEFATSSFGVVVLACVVSATITQAIEIGGLAPEFGSLSYTLGSLAEMPLYLLLGLLLAPVCAFFIRFVYWMHDQWHRLGHHLPRPLTTALAAGLVGVIGVFFPQVLGVGRETMVELLNSSDVQITFLMLFVLAAVKMLASSITLAGGFVGGVFAPALFVGTTLGSAFGRVIDALFPGGAVSDPRAYAIAGMAAALAGVIRAPITSIMIVFEATNDYRLILPIMLASVACVFLSERFEPLGINTFGLARHGIRLRQNRDIDVMQALHVRDAMVTPPPSIHCDQPLVALRDGLRRDRAHGLVVVDEANRVVGIATLADLRKAYDEGKADARVEDICVKDVLTSEPDEPLWTAMRLMGERAIERLPVVNPHTNEALGVLTRNSIMRAYNQAITRKIEQQHTEEELRLHALTGAHVVDYLVRPGAEVAGKKVKEVTWPSESAIAAIRRGERLIVPRGGTDIKLWDRLTFVTDPRAETDLARLTGQPAAAEA